MEIVKTANATWQGNLKDGKGILNTQSGALSEHPYEFNTRFEDKEGTNPEELVGAALSGCYAMAFSKELSEKYKVELIHVAAKVYLEKDDNGFSIPKIELHVNAEIPQIEDVEFSNLANRVKENCPIGKLLNAEIILKTELKN